VIFAAAHPPHDRVLRGVIGVFRHGDRTPKQKVKIKTSNKAVISFFSKYGRPEKELKMKNTTHMAQLLTLRDIALEELERGPDKMDGIAPSDYEKLHLFKVVLNKNYGGLKVQLKPRRVETVENLSTCTELLVVLKWGGVLTHSGMRQATQVGEALRDIVGDIVGPGQSTRQGESIPSSSVQLMSNNERRVKQTALLVGRELLRNPDLPEEFIIDNTLSKELLDDVSQADSIIEQQKRELHEIMHVSDASEVNDLPTLRALVPRPRYHMECVHKLMKELQIVSGSLHFCGGEPVDVLLDRWKRLRADFYDPVRGKFDTTKIPDIFDFVTYEVQHNQKALKYSSSALPGLDLYHLFDKAERMARFLVPKEYGVRARDKLVIGSVVSGPLFNSICDDVCAISGVDEKARSTFTGEEPDMAMGIPLIPDEGLSGVFGSEGHGPTTRLYFTSESHLQTLRNVLIHNGVSQLHDLIEPVELNYLTHILFLVWEDVPTFTEESSHERVDVGSLDDFNSSPLESVSAPQLPLPFDQDDRVFVEVRFSAGASKNPWGITGEHYNEVGPAVTLHNHMPLATLEGIRRIVSELMTRQPDP
jgi:inositol-hexakisphosphate/diphosphoinositol-pentakisphosphate 1-kinase